MARTKEEREQRRLEAKERASQRKAAKVAAKEAGIDLNDTSQTTKKLDHNELNTKLKECKENNATLPLLSLPIDALAKIVRFLPAREFGVLGSTCTSLNHTLGGCRIAHISSRLMRRVDEDGKQSSCGSMCLVGGLQLCSGRKEAQVSHWKRYD